MDSETLRLVVGFDFGAGGQRALRHAFAMARRHAQCEVHVLYACGASEQPASAQWLDLPGKLWRWVDEVARELPSTSKVRVVTHVRRGSAERCLVRLAAQFQADYILLGGPLDGRLGGETAAGTEGKQPIWVVHADDSHWQIDQTRRQMDETREAAGASPGPGPTRLPADESALYTGSRRVAAPEREEP